MYIFKKLPAVILAFYFAVFAPAQALAFNWGSLAGALIGSNIQRAQILRAVNYYDTDGREDLFEAYKDYFAAKSDPVQNALLSNVVERLSREIAKHDVSIIDRPYNYFIVPEEDFNAACGLGHNMFVNEGVFTLTGNDEDMLAAVVAHEMIHGQMDHNLKGIRKQLSTLVFRNAIASQVGDYGSMLLLDLATRHVINTGITKPGEWEADNLSYPYFVAAGYNPGAPAALWQSITENADMNKGGGFLNAILNPSTHPKAKERRDNFSLKLTAHSNNIVTVDSASGEIKINGLSFMTPSDIEKAASGKQRAYMIAGRLAALYAGGQQLDTARTENGSVLIGGTLIVTPAANDKSAAELAEILNMAIMNL